MITSFRHDRKRHTRRNVIFVSLIVGLLIVLANWGVTSALFGEFFQIALAPAFAVKDLVQGQSKTLFSYLDSKDQLTRENKLLNEKVLQLELETYQLEALQAENEKLKQAFERLPDANKYILAKVLAMPIVSPYDTLLIDLGMYDGVGEGMRVYYEGGFVLGEVSTSYRHSSLVQLYSSDGVSMQGYIGSSTVPVTVQGVGGGNFRVFLPRGAEVSVGDPIRIPSLGASFLGTVEHIDVSETSSLMLLYIKLPFDYRRIEHLYVAIPTTNR